MRHVPAAMLAMLPWLVTPAEAQQQPNSIVEDALKAAEREQRRDEGKVERMSEEAAKAASGAPSGAEAVGSTAMPAQAATRTAAPAIQDEAALRKLVQSTLSDRDGRPVGRIEDVMPVHDGSGTTIVLVQADDGHTRGINAARLQAGPEQGASVDLDREGIAQLPRYERDGDAWRMAD